MPKNNNKKRVNFKNLPSCGKKVKIEEVEKSLTKAPVWQFQKIDLDGPFGWSQIDKDILLSKILAKIKIYENRTWRDILVQARKHNHYIDISRLSPDAKTRLKELRIDGIDQVCSLGEGLGSKARIFGIRTGHIFQVLWWDPEHKVCPSAKSNT